MAEKGKFGKRIGCLALVGVWLVVFAGMAVAYKVWVIPQYAKHATIEIPVATPTQEYERNIRIALDDYAGYAPLRSPQFRKQLAGGDIGLELRHDSADYQARFAALSSGEVHYATFSLDGYLRLCIEQDKVPGQIVAVLAESSGADAIVAHSRGVPNLRALDQADLRIVYREGTPSEFLARVVVASFDLPNLGDNWGEARAPTHDVLKQLRGADPSEPRAYVLWEPDLSRALETNGIITLIDSTRMQGYILDVLVASPDSIADAALSRTLLSAWFSALEHLQRMGLKERIVADSAKSGQVVDIMQARTITDGISWKSLADNRGYFDGALAGSMNKVLDVLIETGAVAESASPGQLALAHSGIIDALMPPAPATEAVVVVAPPELETLTVDAWANLVEVGRAKVPPVAFARGRADISRFSLRPLDKLATTLNSWSKYYIKIIGNARSEGDSEANQALAKARAESVRKVLIGKGVQSSRMRAETGELTGAAAQSVTFVLLENP
ncbi:MAG: outer membrane protein OmpA-like peptidoglycan-associated protein [Rhodothermales bacterium]|jgi:outer membrane protein OmpA-like peptidoglycan-associated protein